MKEYKHVSNEFKVVVKVIAEYDLDGNITPKYFIWEDGRKFEIDKILEIKRAASIAAGGLGIKYTCQVCGKQTYLYRDNNIWFMERKQSHS